MGNVWEITDPTFTCVNANCKKVKAACNITAGKVAKQKPNSLAKCR